MCLFDLVEQQDAVRTATDCFRQLPPSSYPTYPGGAPKSRETVCCSRYSDMSIRTRASSSSNMNQARALASSVLPTPDGPMKINEPMGRDGSFNPDRARRIASEMA